MNNTYYVNILEGEKLICKEPINSMDDMMDLMIKYNATCTALESFTIVGDGRFLVEDNANREIFEITINEKSRVVKLGKLKVADMPPKKNKRRIS